MTGMSGRRTPQPDACRIALDEISAQELLEQRLADAVFAVVDLALDQVVYFRLGGQI